MHGTLQSCWKKVTDTEGWDLEKEMAARLQCMCNFLYPNSACPEVSSSIHLLIYFIKPLNKIAQGQQMETDHTLWYFSLDKGFDQTHLLVVRTWTPKNKPSSTSIYFCGRLRWWQISDTGCPACQMSRSLNENYWMLQLKATFVFIYSVFPRITHGEKTLQWLITDDSVYLALGPRSKNANAFLNKHRKREAWSPLSRYINRLQS